MNFSKRSFGNLQDGIPVNCWTIRQDHIEAEILDYGATIRAIRVPDRFGTFVDVVLGYDRIEDYVTNGGSFGATIGRFANRIGGASFELNGRIYPLVKNNGENHIHGGLIGFSRAMWNAEARDDGLWLSRLSPDGEEGYPGNLDVSIRMSLVNNGLQITYFAKCDQDTILNLTNHTYFNLNGEGTIQDQKLMICADRYTVSDSGCLPTGEIGDVAGMALDFRAEKSIGRDADADEPCVRQTGGYDVNYILSGNPAAVARSEQSGIVMTVTTDQPGIQLYTANHMAPRVGKNGAVYAHRAGFCLETQHYPDCIHHPDWPSCILRSGELFKSTTMYHFSLTKG